MAHVLPPEVLEVMFGFLDGASLIQTSRVCKHFYNVAQTVDKDVYFWKSTCRYDIDQNVLDDLITVPPKRAIDWKELYSKYHRSQYVDRWVDVKTALLPETGCKFGKCVAVKVHGEFVITVHSSHFIVFWYSLTSEIRAFVQSSNTGNQLVGILPRADLIFHENGNIFVITISKQWIYVTNLHECNNEIVISHAHSEPVTDFCVYGHTLVTSSYDHFLNGHCVIDIALNGSDKFRMRHRLHGHTGPATCVTMWKNKVLSAGDDGQLLLWDLEKHSETESDVSDFVVVCHEPGYIHNLQLRGNTIIYTGMLHVYHVKTPPDLKSLKIDAPSAKFKLQGPITCIDIGDDDDSPVITAVSGSQVEIIRWYPPD